MLISLAQLVACGIGPTQARTFVYPINEACQAFDIDTPPRLAAFLAQCKVESRRFADLEEDLTYRRAERIREVFGDRVSSLQQAGTLVGKPEALANVVYANKNGNGDPNSGDGWRYRGRGLIQLTGRANYMAAGAALGMPYKDQPDLVATPRHSCLTAAQFFAANGCNELADSSQIDKITRKVNRAMLHAAERRQAFEEAVRVLL
ncbi:glycoside hydrolase family 19 protein [Caldimonas sp. KR1-144]|uniref:glycoside hydrolase family 19 protein n=1 Tax=Caldimonas sp. KR1-144 TaxID=3400911 RepID=UPI003C0C5E7C